MSSTLDIRAPAEQTEGTRSQVLRWLKAIGDEVSEHEPLIEIETDKVTVEVAAPGTGVLREIVKAEQDEIAPGEVLGRIELAGVESAQADDTRPVPASAAPPAAASADGAMPVGDDAVGEAREAGTAASLSRLSPAVRRLLSERDLDPSTIRATGEGGRITIDDVLAHAVNPSGAAKPASIGSFSPALGAPAMPAAVVAPSPDAAASSSAPVVAHAEARVSSHSIPHTAVRKRIAEHMVQSLLHTAPHVTTVFETDMAAVIAHRAAHRAEFEKRRAPLTFTAYFLAAAVEAIRAVPEVNSRWTDSALEVYDDIHIGVATALEAGGLMVPVLRDVQSRDLFAIASGLHKLVTAAREGRLQPADVRGGTFTISNHGVSGSLLAAPIVINQPQSAILGVGKLEKRAVVVEQGTEERIVVQPKCYVTLTIDHRVMDGHQANRFLQTFVRALEAWPVP
jgi:2-oxoglutarate dehydrogenase E2 component (dihydrolipoamide succinyltransferase)